MTKGTLLFGIIMPKRSVPFVISPGKPGRPDYSSADSSVEFFLFGKMAEKTRKAIRAETRPGTIVWLK